MGPAMPRWERAADPYGDLDVIDSRAPRFNQATIGLLAALAVVGGWWWLLGLLALQLVVGSRSGGASRSSARGSSSRPSPRGIADRGWLPWPP